MGEGAEEPLRDHGGPREGHDDGDGHADAERQRAGAPRPLPPGAVRAADGTGEARVPPCPEGAGRGADGGAERSDRGGAQLPAAEPGDEDEFPPGEPGHAPRDRRGHLGPDRGTETASAPLPRRLVGEAPPAPGWLHPDAARARARSRRRRGAARRPAPPATAGGEGPEGGPSVLLRRGRPGERRARAAGARLGRPAGPGSEAALLGVPAAHHPDPVLPALVHDAVLPLQPADLPVLLPLAGAGRATVRRGERAGRVPPAVPGRRPVRGAAQPVPGGVLPRDGERGAVRPRHGGRHGAAVRLEVRGEAPKSTPSWRPKRATSRTR